jgi:phosphatidylglycerophosphate synthase
MGILLVPWLIFQKWVWTVPNMVTLGRLFIGLWGQHVFTWWYWNPWYVLLFTVIAFCGDIVDGRLARWLGQESESGALLDPLVDKVLVWSTVTVFITSRCMYEDWFVQWCVVASLPMFGLVGLYDYMTMTLRGIDSQMKTGTAAKEKQAVLFIAMGLLMLGMVFGDAAMQTQEHRLALALTDRLLTSIGLMVLGLSVHKLAESARKYLAATNSLKVRTWGERPWIALLLRVL